ncbi:hypothetical protein NKW53_05500 [Acetobacter orientalis]|uniref:hypothetical protein n=1 Tax=Acetobacter orientalis TaxID=146474 RepID=UPI00209D9DFF|nr:hypothetical protein [Acetobacter orientalis]MCP1215520.1 hypothetical protein [Acetobacter orientalis]MCP1217627.1 hypothetical protein [Acetobacter orientalis]
MTKIHCFTSASFSYLDRVRVLGETLRRHNPDWEFTFCLSDIEPKGFVFNLEEEPIDSVVRIEELGIPLLDSWMFEHDIVELCTAVKGKMLCRLLEQGAEKVVYIDPDIAVFSDLSDIDRALDTHDVILTPHQLYPDSTEEAIRDNEIGSLKFGIYNLGFVAVSGRAEGYRFAKWWRDRLLSFCFDDVPNGLFTDQKWCDHVPAFFENVMILRDPGYNVASWNLSQRPIAIDSDGIIRAANSILKFFHFTKVTWAGEVMLERYCGNRVEVFELMYWYRAQLARNAPKGVPDRWWAFGRYENGNPIPKHHRLAYRQDRALQRQFPNPFSSGSHSFEQFMEQRKIS